MRALLPLLPSPACHCEGNIMSKRLLRRYLGRQGMHMDSHAWDRAVRSLPASLPVHRINR